jgi:hypothetical protein
MAKIVYYQAFGGFSLEKELKELVKLYTQLKQIPYDNFDKNSIPRHDPTFVRVVEKFKSEGKCDQLSILEVPEGQEYIITEHDGHETVRLKDTIKWKVAKS